MSFCVFGGSCSRFCDGSGCWGPGPGDCVACTHYWRDGECVGECDVADGFYINATSKHCLRCSPECRSTCSGLVNSAVLFLLLNFVDFFLFLTSLSIVFTVFVLNVHGCVSVG